MRSFLESILSGLPPRAKSKHPTVVRLTSPARITSGGQSEARRVPPEVSLRALEVERVRDLRLAVDLPHHVDLVVLAVGADPPGAPEPAPEAEPPLLGEVRVE